MSLRQSGKGRFGVLALVITVLAAFFAYPLTLDIPLLDPDEGLHASIAQEMVERGDWVLPRFLGEPFLDKPILYSWAEALSLRLFGMHEAAVRLPGLMFGLLGVVTTGFVGWRMFDQRTGLVAGLFYATMILPTALAQAAAHDVALIPCVNLALLLFWESDLATTRKASIGCTVLIGLLLGLSVLTKGLVGVAVVGTAYGAYLLVTRRLSLAACGKGAAALAIAVLVAAPWYIAVELRSPGYLRYWFVERHLLGYLASEQFHGKAPWWYYLPLLVGGGLPWIVYLPVLVQDDWVRRRTPKDGDSQGARCGDGRSNGAIILLWCWLIGGTVFLSVAHSKLVTYIWPVFPTVALLGAVVWTRLLEGALSQGARRTLSWTFILSCALGPLLLPTTIIVVQEKYGLWFSWPVWTAAILAALTLWVPPALWPGRRPWLSLSSAMCSLAIQFAFVMTVVLPRVASTTSARELACYFNRRGQVPHRLLFADERIGSFVFYLRSELRARLREGQLQQVRLRDFPGNVNDAVIAVPVRRADRTSECSQLAGRAFHLVGHYRAYERTSRPSGARLRRPDPVGAVVPSATRCATSQEQACSR